MAKDHANRNTKEVQGETVSEVWCLLCETFLCLDLGFVFIVFSLEKRTCPQMNHNTSPGFACYSLLDIVPSGTAGSPQKPLNSQDFFSLTYGFDPNRQGSGSITDTLALDPSGSKSCRYTAGGLRQWIHRERLK